jgi:hypothetical protein
LHIGLSRNEAYSIPYGELCDLVAVEQIKTEGAKAKRTKGDEEREFFRLLSFN